MVQLNLTNRVSLMSSLPKGGVGVEIGVAEGVFSKILLGVCRPSMLYLIDPWVHQEKEALREDSSNVSQEAYDNRYTQVIEWAKTEPQIQVIRGYSLDVVNDFCDGVLDWFHVDGDHTIAGRDLKAYWLKLRSGGWATGHDFVMVGDHITVKRQVNTFAEEEGLDVLVTRGDCGNIYERHYPTWAIQKP